MTIQRRPGLTGLSDPKLRAALYYARKRRLARIAAANVSGDPFYSNVLFMKNDWTTFDDEGPNSFATTNLSDPAADSIITFNGFNTLELDGNDGVQIEGTSTLGSIANTDDFTWEAYIRFTSLASISTIISKRDAGGAEEGRLLVLTDGTLQWAAFSGGATEGTITSTTVLAINTWYHVALTREAEFYNMWIEGVLETGSGVSAGLGPSPNSQNIQIGFNAFNATRHFTGNIGPVRLTQGVARYTENFTPETSFPTG